MQAKYFASQYLPHCQRLERLVAKMRRSGYLPSDFPDLTTLVEEADCKLFKNVRRSNTHVLRHYITGKPVPTRLLRVRAHNCVLPPRDNRDFISRALYKALGLSNGYGLPVHHMDSC